MSSEAAYSAAAYSAATNVSVTDFSVQALINAGLDIDVSVSLQFSFIIVVTVFVICFEYVLESIEHVIARHPTYWTLLNKMYRELLVGGLTAFVAKRLDQWDAIAKYDQAKLNISDDIVLYFSLSIAIQSAIMFMMLRVRNEKVDKLSVLSARDLLEYMSTDDGANPWSQFSKSIMTTKILQNFFLTTYKLPDVFSFPKYVRSIQDSEIFSLFDVEIIEWILLVAVYTIFFWIADDFESIRFIEEDATDDIIEAGIDVEHAKMILATRLEVLLVYILILTIALWALYAYVRRRVHDIVLHASNGRKSYLEALEDIANKEDARLAKPMTNDEAIAVMMEFADSLTDVEDHSSIWDLIKSGARRLVGRAHAKDKSHMQVANLHLPFFSRKAVHVFAKLLLSFNAMYFALIWSAFNASVVPVIKSKQATWYPLSLLGLMAILVFNMLFFAPQLVRHLALVNATVRVNPHELKAVIEHFSDVLEMQTDMADAIVTYCDAHGKDIKDLEHDIVAMDPQATGYIEGEALRDIISHYGFKFSANKFQTFVRLQFKTRGTRVPYADFCRVLYGLTEQLTSQHDSLSELLSGKNLHSEYLNSLRRDRPSESFLSGTTSSHGQRRPNHAMLFKLSAINQFNAKDNAESQAKVSPRKVAAVAV
ncbi:hypothetical protein LEN26_019386 [Aphanomyces euteiches]|nr:hypothetical protein LEN26_019386 [Aphanomyces euteiches]KAH9105516.1 hypothetical protein AeMF1_018695 [Aphanomyces euteiches]KAH9192925.1 hypothetical protein AeNC1_005096 [Aphanomyces euteiches]